MTEPKFKNLFEPTPKNLLKWSWGIKAFVASTGLTALAAGYTWLAATLAVLGGIADFCIACYKKEDDV